MNEEEQRLRTFASWPANAAVEAPRIAKAGFFYTGRELEVECFSCRGRLADWNYGDQVMAKHRTIYPDCAFVKNPTGSGNVPLLGGGGGGVSLSAPATPQPQPAAWQDSVAASTAGSTSLYVSESSRLDSFRSWPVPHIVAPEELVRAGFYYLQEDDKVQCVFCSGVIHNWEAGDSPVEEHRRHFPTCPSLFKPAASDAAPAPGGDARDADPSPGDDEEVVLGVKALGIQPHRGPRQPRYATYESRLQSFRDWPSDVTQRPEQLAQAGFYHTGESDKVRCFHCDGGLSRWDPADDPWAEHARWFPNCGLVVLVKGADFVSWCLDRYPPLVDPGQVEAASYSMREVLEAEVDELMRTSVALGAAEGGASEEQLRAAIRLKLQSTGLPFSTSEALLQAAASMPRGAERASSQPGAPASSREGDRTPAEPTSPASLEEEFRRLKEARLCKVCMDQEVSVVFLPCGHLVSCNSCAPSMRDCPMCRQPIRATVRTFHD
ncbi:baculoviral IAP repeat-containing protein 7-A-like [Bacillus rossius redtenbacheri]|uniref:baculoviral IAP repeat-containing protein 7-A-like n=1 Tax=Bacillus rossius redtenbacheri TaxID=93214 RepID=UPI002FDC823C